MPSGMRRLLVSEPRPVFGRPGVVPDEGEVAEAAQVGTVIVSVSVETVPPNAKARPSQLTVLPIVMPALSMSVPLKVELAPRVVAAVGVHQTSQDEAPPAKATTELAEVVRAPSILKM